MRVTGVDACRGGWVAVSLDETGPATVRVHETLTGLLGQETVTITGIDMPLGLLEAGWREADLAARGPARPPAQLGLRHPAPCGLGAGQLPGRQRALPCADRPGLQHPGLGPAGEAARG